jgi:hypothetical protein
MPLSKGYACLKGRPIGNRIATSRKPHYQVHISANGVHYRIAINVQSNDGSEVQYLVRSQFLHPLTDSLSSLAQGRMSVDSRPGGIALDFIRGNLAQPWEFVPLPMTASGPDNDLNEKLDAYVQRAMSDEAAMIYAFGEPWGPEPQKADDYFVPADPAFPGQPHTPIDPNVIPPLSLPDGLVRIIAAYVNDVKTPEHETVTLLNTADVAVDLQGWMIADKQKNKCSFPVRSPRVPRWS